MDGLKNPHILPIPKPVLSLEESSSGSLQYSNPSLSGSI
jgi:hypothetical protein